MRELFHYQLFGLNIVSELSLSGIKESNFSNPDLYIKIGSVPSTLDNYKDKGVFYYAAPGRFLFEMDSVGRFWVNEGKEIIIEKHKTAIDTEVNLFLLGSVMGAALLQRGLTPLHGSAILKDGRAIVIGGKSGAGKSSLAAAFINRGYSLLSDDITVIDVQNDLVHVKRGIQRLKLWADSLKSLQLEESTSSRVRPSLEKFYLPYSGPATPRETELTAIIILEVKNSKGYTIEELTGVEKFEYIRSNASSSKGNIIPSYAINSQSVLSLKSTSGDVSRSTPTHLISGHFDLK